MKLTPTRTRGPVTFINGRPGTPVRIHCPDPERWPSFARAFDGVAGKIVEVEPKGVHNVVIVDVSTHDTPGAWIHVERAWLSHNDGRQLV